MILLALNELNLEFIKGYINDGKLPNFKRLIKNGLISTTSEQKYELLEPWIQWTTVHTGKSYDEHKIFRLGDIIQRHDLVQIFEDLEQNGLSVAAISPFNADNRLKSSKFFIPDPWTQTNTSGDYILKRLSKTISTIVNKNASGKVGIKNVIWLIIGFVKYIRLKRWFKFFALFLQQKKPGIKAAILDMILLEIFVTLQKKYSPDYSHLFFNGVAHVQHHYMFNSKQYKGSLKNPEWYCPKDWDPIYMMLETYDIILGDLMETGERIIGLTGLNQIPHDQQTFYWRPVNHSDFLTEAGVKEEFTVIPRMSRDFLISCSSNDDAIKVESHLNQFTDSVRNKPVFNIDNRGDSLFVEIIYDYDLDKTVSFNGPNNLSISNLLSKLAFVAIKNGKHDGKGYLFSNMDLDLPKEIKLKEVYNIIKNIALADAKKI